MPPKPPPDRHLLPNGDTLVVQRPPPGLRGLPRGTIEKKKPLIGGSKGMRKIPSMKEGGMVEKTMLHHLHKGEMVVPAHLVKHFSKLMKK